jgi:hypothetical protein
VVNGPFKIKPEIVTLPFGQVTSKSQVATVAVVLATLTSVPLNETSTFEKVNVSADAKCAASRKADSSFGIVPLDLRQNA